MAHTKNTLAQKQRTLEFFIDENGRFSWGEESDETADEILGETKRKTSEHERIAITLVSLLASHLKTEEGEDLSNAQASFHSQN